MDKSIVLGFGVFALWMHAAAGCAELAEGVDEVGGVDESTDDGSEGTDESTSTGAPCGGCGNGQIEIGEVCDLDNLDGETCASQGYARGLLQCDGCDAFDASKCTDGNCCDPQLTGGCEVPFVEICVCAADPYCCATAWDDACVSIAIDQCAAQCGV
jgi:hypothetical protein